MTASVVQWYDESLPSIRPGFDSPLMHLPTALWGPIIFSSLGWKGWKGWSFYL